MTRQQENRYSEVLDREFAARTGASAPSGSLVGGRTFDDAAWERLLQDSSAQAAWTGLAIAAGAILGVSLLAWAGLRWLTQRSRGTKRNAVVGACWIVTTLFLAFVFDWPDVFSEAQIAAIVLLPPVLAALGAAAWRWASK